MSGWRAITSRLVIAAVDAMYLTAFFADSPTDDCARPAHDPPMMVALFVYAYARAQRSSRAVPGGHRLSRDRCEPSAGSLHDRAVSSASRNGAGRVVR
jgi:hypothetical protein